MRLHRPSVRDILIVGLIIGAAAGIGYYVNALLQDRDRFLDTAAWHERRANEERATLESVKEARAKGFDTPDLAFVDRLSSCRVEYHARMLTSYRDAADHPWTGEPEDPGDPGNSMFWEYMMDPGRLLLK